MRSVLTRSWPVCVGCLILAVIGQAVRAEPLSPQAASMQVVQAANGLPVLIEPGPDQTAVLYADGSRVSLKTQTVWRWMCGSQPDVGSAEALGRVAAQAEDEISRLGPVGAGAARAAGLDLVFTVSGDPPPGALQAIEDVELYIESLFDDPITVSIYVSFAELSPGVLGATGSRYTSAIWPTIRDGLQADMDPSDFLQNYLPAGGSIPVRYDGSSSVVTNEIEVYVTRANFRAAIGSVSGLAASMTFNTNFTWDYTPPNIDGNAHDFTTVLAHEVGHALGFTSGADFRFEDMEMLDIYRFPRPDGQGTDYNPDTVEEFQTTSRMVDQDAPGTNDTVNSDLIFAQYRMSDGNPNQASHFHANTPGIYVMDPSLASGETFYPNYYRIGDLDMFDAIGWDYSDCNRNDIHDETDLADGTSFDCDGNGMLDECQILQDSVEGQTTFCIAACAPDCNLNAVPDSCDVANGTLHDADGSGEPDECEASDSPLNADGLHGDKKNRYISFKPNNGTNEVAFRVELIASEYFPDSVGILGWVGEPFDPGCPDNCTGDFIARVVPDPVYRVWPETVVQVGDCEIVPVASYQLRATADEVIYPPPIVVDTIDRPGALAWGDCVGFFMDGFGWLGPDGVTNFNDVSAAIRLFQAGPYAPHITWVDLHGGESGDATVDPPNAVANFADVQQIIKAFQGEPYPYSDPALCP